MKDIFSIVIPVYNRAELVKRTLGSIAAQTYRPLQVVLVDNNSTDNSLAVLENWQKSVLSADLTVTVIEETCPGAAAARQAAMPHVRGQFMLFFDSDDVLSPHAVEEYVKAFRQTGADIILSPSVFHYPDGSKRIMHHRKGSLLTSHIHHSTLRTQGYAVRSVFFRRNGGWDSRALIWNDWELGVRLLLARPSVARIAYPAAHIYSTGDSITGVNFSSREGLYEYPIAKVEGLLVSHPDVNLRKLAFLMAYKRVMLAAHYRREGNKKLSLQGMETALSSQKSGLKRLLLKLCYHYILHGGRGIDRLLSLYYSD